MKAYGVASHRHTPEIEEQLGYAAGKEILINFTPHLVPMNRGILATEYATLKKKPDGTLPTYDEIKAVYDKYYANEKFVRVLKKGVCPETKWVEGSNYVDVNFVIDEIPLSAEINGIPCTVVDVTLFFELLLCVHRVVQKI